MAGKESELSTSERAGAVVRNVGLVIALVGLIGMWAEWPLPNEEAVVGGGVLAASGEIFRRVVKPKQK